MRKRHSPAIKAKIVLEALKEEKTITQIASENDIHPNQISTWKAAAIAGLPTLFEMESKAHSEKAAHQQQLEELYAQIGRLTTQASRLRADISARRPTGMTICGWVRWLTRFGYKNSFLHAFGFNARKGEVKE